MKLILFILKNRIEEKLEENLMKIKLTNWKHMNTNLKCILIKFSNFMIQFILIRVQYMAYIYKRVLCFELRISSINFISDILVIAVKALNKKSQITKNFIRFNLTTGDLQCRRCGERRVSSGLLRSPRTAGAPQSPLVTPHTLLTSDGSTLNTQHSTLNTQQLTLTSTPNS